MTGEDRRSVCFAIRMVGEAWWELARAFEEGEEPEALAERIEALRRLTTDAAREVLGLGLTVAP